MLNEKNRVICGPNLVSLLCCLLICLSLNACGSDQNTAGGATQATITRKTSSNPISTAPAATSTPVGSTPALANQTPISSEFTPTPEPTVRAATSSDWEYDWLKGISCAVPCWEGITPGKTPYSEAIKILRQLPFVRDIQEQKSSTDPGALWQWTNDNRNFARADMRYNEKDTQSIITNLELEFPKSFKLSEVIRVYGEPDYVWTEKQTTYLIRLVFLKPGITLSYNNRNKPILADDMLFSGVWFVPSGSLQDYTKSIRCNCSLLSLPRWQGYKSFDFYDYYS